MVGRFLISQTSAYKILCIVVAGMMMGLGKRVIADRGMMMGLGKRAFLPRIFNSMHQGEDNVCVMIF